VSTTGIFTATAVFTVLGTAWALWLLPEALLRAVLVILTNSLYRLRIVGHEHVPKASGALLVPNHVSFIDGLLLIASLDRHVRFVVDAQYAEQPLFKPLMRLFGAIPIPPTAVYASSCVRCAMPVPHSKEVSWSASFLRVRSRGRGHCCPSVGGSNAS
jgi:1-acyl-sn-glycerol-3-phosphate acyltransferase